MNESVRRSMEELRRLIKAAKDLIAAGHRQSNELQQLIDESKARLRDSEALQDGDPRSKEGDLNSRR